MQRSCQNQWNKPPFYVCFSLAKLIITQEFSDSVVHTPRVDVTFTRGRNTTQGSINVNIVAVKINFKASLSFYTLV